MELALLLAALFTLLMTMAELPTRSGTPLRHCFNVESLPYFGLTLVAHIFTTFLAFYAPISLGHLEAGRFFLAAIFGVFAAQTVLRHVKIPIFDGEPDIPRWREKALVVALRAARRRQRDEREAAKKVEKIGEVEKTGEVEETEAPRPTRRLAGIFLFFVLFSAGVLSAFFLGRAPFLLGETTMPDGLLQARKMLDSGDFQRAEQWAVAETVTAGPRIRAEAEWILAKIRTRQRRLEEAQRFAESAHDGFEQSGDLLGRARTLRLLGQIVHDQGHRGWAAERYREALRILQDGKIEAEDEDEAVEERIAALVDLSILRGEESALQEARETLEEALYQARLHGSQRSAEIYGNLAEVLRRSGELTTAARRFETARDLFRERGDARGEAWSSLGLADVRRTLGDLETAESGYIAARRDFDEEDPTGLAWARHGEGILRLLRGDLAAARQALEESLASHLARGETRWAVAVRMSLAQLALAQERPREAAEWADSAAQELKREGRSDLAAQAYALGALARLEEGNLEAASKLVAWTIDARISEELDVRLTVLRAGALHALLRGDPSAEDLARKMLSQARSSGHLAGQWEARLLLIKIDKGSESSMAHAAALAVDASNSGHFEIARRASLSAGAGEASTR